jgi:hypothetical protein
VSLEIAIPVALAILTVVVGYLGIHLTLHPLPTEAVVLRKAQRRYKVSFVALSLLAVALIAWQAYLSQPHPSLWHRPMKHSEERSFIAILKHESTPPRLRVGCSANDDSACALALELVYHFQAAGWHVEKVPPERLALPRALIGVSIFAHGSGTADPSNLQQGLWVAQTPQLRTLSEALGSVGINATVSADATLPEGIYGIYCGTDPGAGTPYYSN